MKCPLNLGLLPPCQKCLYGGKSGCLFSSNLTPEKFAVEKGISSVQAPVQIEAAEKRIQCGLTLLIYLDWAKPKYSKVDFTVSSEIKSIYSSISVYREIRLSIEMFLHLADFKTWAAFKESTKVINFSLHEVLLMTEWQLEEITSFLNAN